MGKQTVTLKLTAAIAVEGKLLKRNQLVEVSEQEAQSLLRRGKAELATSADEPEPAEEDEVTEAPATKTATTGKNK